MSTGMLGIAYWKSWSVHLKTNTWSSWAVELIALLSSCAGDCSWYVSSCSVLLTSAIIVEALSGVETGLLIGDRLAFINDLLVIKEVWSMSTDIHLLGDSNSLSI
jgi:hypothetical protein